MSDDTDDPKPAPSLFTRHPMPAEVLAGHPNASETTGEWQAAHQPALTIRLWIGDKGEVWVAKQWEPALGLPTRIGRLTSAELSEMAAVAAAMHVAIDELASNTLKAAAVQRIMEGKVEGERVH